MNPYFSANCVNVSAAYGGPLYDITTSGMPWRAKNDFNCSIIDSESVRWIWPLRRIASDSQPQSGTSSYASETSMFQCVPMSSLETQVA